MDRVQQDGCENVDGRRLGTAVKRVKAVAEILRDHEGDFERRNPTANAVVVPLDAQSAHEGIRKVAHVVPEPDVAIFLLESGFHGHPSLLGLSALGGGNGDMVRGGGGGGNSCHRRCHGNDFGGEREGDTSTHGTRWDETTARVIVNTHRERKGNLKVTDGVLFSPMISYSEE